MFEGNNPFASALERALESLALEDISIDGAGMHRDATVRLGGRPIRLALRWAGRGWPHEVEEAVRDVGEPWPLELVVVAREFSAGALRLLRARRANWADLAGQARIVVPDRLAVLREPPRSPASVAKPQLLRWSPSAVSTAEAVLTHDSPIRTARLAELTGWSTPQVSKVLQAFDRRGWTRRTGPQRGPTASREIADREGLLAEWSEWLREQQRPRRFAHTTRRDALALVDDELATALARHSWMLSGWAGAALLAPLSTTVPTVQAYVSADDFRDLPSLLADTSLHLVDEGGRIEFWPADEHTLRLAHREGRVPVASPPRVYADLRRFGDRGADAADHLRTWWLEAPTRRGDSQ